MRLSSAGRSPARGVRGGLIQEWTSRFPLSPPRRTRCLSHLPPADRSHAVLQAEAAHDAFQEATVLWRGPHVRVALDIERVGHVLTFALCCGPPVCLALRAGSDAGSRVTPLAFGCLLSPSLRPADLMVHGGGSGEMGERQISHPQALHPISHGR